jgi:hypothetical protein
MKTVFLSTSIPLPERNPKYYDTADVIAIRDSVKALVTIVAPKGRIVFGGHPAITPMIRLMMREMGLPVRDHIVLFQSLLFKPIFPPDNDAFESVRLVQAVGEDRNASLLEMRLEMLKSEQFDAGVFIGGMEGVEEEYALFREIYPDKPAHPIASTGAAALIIYERLEGQRSALKENLLYLSLFRELLEVLE